jgi:formate hydrogenlyase transcriptional activator
LQNKEHKTPPFGVVTATPFVQQSRIVGTACVEMMEGGSEEFMASQNIISPAHDGFPEMRFFDGESRSPCETSLGLPQEFEGIVGSSEALMTTLNLVRTVAPTDSTVLIEGETGTGKELIARAIHANSKRKDRPFAKLNCAAIPVGLLESELFGHERGAFTSAVARKVGRFEAADRGTLFLDEIGDIPLELQPKLLRVLQDGEFERLGSTQTLRVDVRVVAATNANLGQMVSEKRFRSDLYYRLNVFPIPVPSLRERAEDIPTLVKHFVAMYAEKMKKVILHIPERMMDIILSHSWPGNIRELQNFVERSVIMSSGGVLAPPLERLAHSAGPCAVEPVTLEDAERSHIRKILTQTKGVVYGANGAAARLGVPRSTLYYRMRKLGISRSRHSVCSVIG